MAAVLVVPLFSKASHKANMSKCMGNLRQLGLATIQYSDDKRFFPHVGAIAQLDGDETSSHTPKVARTLLWFGYHDNPEGWVCPASQDAYQPVTAIRVQTNPRLWFWDQKYMATEGQAPLATQGRDPALEDTSELSYAWTRRGYTLNVRSNRALAADRALKVKGPSLLQTDSRKPGHVGNHSDGWNVLRADATVEFIPTGFYTHEKSAAIDWLTGTTGKRAGALPVHRQKR